MLLHDPQTSGGLLAAFRAGRPASWTDRRVQHEGQEAWVIGDVIEGKGSRSCEQGGTVRSRYSSSPLSAARSGAGGMWFLVGRAEPPRPWLGSRSRRRPRSPSPHVAAHATAALVVPTVPPRATPSRRTHITPRTHRHAPATLPTPLPSLAEIVAQVNPSIVTVINARAVPGVNNSTSRATGLGLGRHRRFARLRPDKRARGGRGAGTGRDDVRTAATCRRVTSAGDGLADLALIKIERDWRFQKLPWGDSTKLQVGDAVAVIGSPLGNLRNSVTTGVVSGLDRTVYLERSKHVSAG